MDIIERASQRRQTAEAILRDLDLMNRWRGFGRPVLVGALAIDVAIAPDIDMEIYCPDLKIEHGFQVISDCAMNPHVTSAQFVNGLNTPDKALYWQLHYCDEAGIDWKVDMWSASEDYALPRGEHFVEPMKAALTPETRLAILTLKEARARRANCPYSYQSISIERSSKAASARPTSGASGSIRTKPAC